jgi:putative ABC transport system permease protein
VFSNYLRTAIRNFFNNPLNSIINLFGLIIGFTCFILITLYINFETSYDKGFTKAESIYRLDHIQTSAQLAITPYIMAETFKEKFTDIDDFVRIIQWKETLKRDNNDAFNELTYFADENLFSMFDFPFVAGDPLTALSAPGNIVLSEDKAIKLFGNINVLDQVLRIRGHDFKVTGVISSSNFGPTTLPLDIILPLKAAVIVRPNFGNWFTTTWNGASVRSYVTLKPGTDVSSFTERASKYADERGKVTSPDRSYGVKTMPLLDIHLHAKSRRGLIPNGSITAVYSFSAIAILILFLACINFMNLSTARATQRAKEVGVRKSLGAYNRQLVAQFIGESVIFATISFVLSLVFVTLLFPYFIDLLGVDMPFALFDGILVVGLLILAILVGAIAGSYPAFYLSAFKPALVLKGNVSRGNAGILLRKGLVILQFAIASMLIIATCVVYSQMQLAKSISLGYERDNLIVLNKVGDSFDAFSNQLLSSPDIETVVMSHVVPTESPRSTTLARVIDEQGEETRVDTDNNYVGYGFFKTYGIKLISGRVFSEEFGQDIFVDNDDEALIKGNVIVTEELVRGLGMTPQSILGVVVAMGSSNSVQKHKVIGVVGSSYYKSIRSPMKAMVYFNYLNKTAEFTLPRTTVKIKDGALLNGLSHIDRTWKQVNPGTPISRTFLDDNYNALYQNEEKQSNMLNVFAILAIIITCLGLFGLASFTTQKRIKEIGIRKVLGATVWQISRLITSEFTRLVIIANVIAWPFSYYFMNDWLQTFANQIDLNPLMFLLSGVLTVGVSWLTVGGLAYKAAKTKPVNSLRCE